MRLTNYELETVINFNEDEDTACLYTASDRVRNHMLKAGLEPVQSNERGWWFEIPKWSVRIKPGRTQVYIGGTTKGTTGG